MPKINVIILIGLAVIFTATSFAEEITVTTYYPAPYGVYREMRAQRMAIGDNYYDAGTYPWNRGRTLQRNEIPQETDLVVEGDVGIGTIVPVSRLHVNEPNGNGLVDVLWLSGTDAGASGNGARIVFNTTYRQHPTWRVGEIGALYDGGGMHGGDIVFRTNTGASYTDVSEKMRIRANGNVGIGTTNPATSLQLGNASNIASAAKSSGELTLARTDGGGWNRRFKIGLNNERNLSIGDFGTKGDDTYTPYITVVRAGAAQAGSVGIGQTRPKYPLEMASGAHVTIGGKWEDASSIEYKTNIVPLTLDSALEALVDLNPVTFNFKVAGDEKHAGFIAEEVPDLVASKDRKSLSPMDIVAVLTRIVQHQQQEINELKEIIRE